MKKIAFMSDFDGTLTFKDFYHIIIDKYLKEDGKKLYSEWKQSKKINVEFLNIIFGSINLSQPDLLKEILDIPFDPAAKAFIETVKRNGWDFYIVSAGTSFYIEILLEHLDIKDVQVVSMKGIYENGGIRILPDGNSPYFHQNFGIDKRKVLDTLKKSYEYVLFAGDSEPDLQAAKGADLVFARSELESLLKKESLDYVSYPDFNMIQNYLIDKGWLK